MDPVSRFERIESDFIERIIYLKIISSLLKN